MSDAMKAVDPWFLNLMVLLLGGYFVYSIKAMLTGFRESIHDLKTSFQASIDDLKKLITELYEHRNNHENCITVLETRCDLHHISSEDARTNIGRRASDKVKL